MTQKQLQPDSKYNTFDVDGDGIVSDDELVRSERMLQIENNDKMQDQQRLMAWVAMLSMVVFTVALFLPILSVERLSALDNLLPMFYIAQAGVVATFFGSSAYMSKN